MAVISKDLGAVTAYAAAVNRGYTGTKEEFETLMASYATVAEQAAESAESAGQSATNASQSAQTAETAKGTAQQAATDAQTAQASAQESAQSAQQSAQSASQSAQTAESAKDTAVDAVDGFAAGAQQALDGVNQAGINWKSLAQAQALDSEAWAVGQRDGEDVGSSDPAYHNNAKYYAESVSASAQTASDAAQTATQKASDAQASASAAAESARTLTIDATLTQSGQAADSKVVGDIFDNITESAKNLFTSKYELGALNYSTGAEVASTSKIRTADYIAVEPETAYIMYNGRDKLRGEGINPCATLFEYDANKAFLRKADIYTSKFTTGENTAYIKFLSNDKTGAGDYLERVNSYKLAINKGNILFKWDNTKRSVPVSCDVKSAKPDNLYYGLYDIRGTISNGAWNYWGDSESVAVLPVEVSGTDLYALCDNSSTSFGLMYAVCYDADGVYKSYVTATNPVTGVGALIRYFALPTGTKYVILVTPAFTRGTDSYDTFRAMIDEHLIITEKLDYAWSRIFRGTSNVITADLTAYDFKNAILDTELRGFVRDGLKSATDAIIDQGYDAVIPVMSDIHSLWHEPYAILNHLSRSGACDLVVNLGDNVTDHFTTKAETLRFLRKVFEVTNAVPTVAGVVNIQGNHDTNPVNSTVSDGTNMIKNAEFYSCARLRTIENFVPEKGCGYVDIENAKLRVIFLNTSDIYGADGTPLVNGNNTMIQQAQLDWLINTALVFDREDKDEWSVITMAHDRLSVLATNDLFGKVIKAFVNGTSVSISGTLTLDGYTLTLNANADFTAQGEMTYICHVNGHYHEDNVIVFGDTFNQISVPSDLAPAHYYVDGARQTYERTAQTIEEHCFDFLCLDKANRAVTMKRFGVGSDRTFTY